MILFVLLLPLLTFCIMTQRWGGMGSDVTGAMTCGLQRIRCFFYYLMSDDESVSDVAISVGP